VLAGLVINEGFRTYVSRRRMHGRLEAQVKESQKRLAEKSLTLAKAQKDDEFLELEARRSLGLVRPDEIEFRFVSGDQTGQEFEEMLRRDPSDSK
jgi:cell division protein FtsB